MKDEFISTEKTVEVAKPIFYGFTILSAFALSLDPSYAGTLLGVAVMAAVSFVSATIADMLEGDWKELTEAISLLTLLAAVLAASYVSTLLAFAN